MLSPAPLDVAFSSMLISNDSDAIVRHARRERVAPHPLRKSSGAKSIAPRERSRSKYPSRYDLECDAPVASVEEDGPRCDMKSSSKRSSTLTCPHCAHVLGISDPDNIPQAGMPFSDEEPYPHLAMVDELAPVRGGGTKKKRDERTDAATRAHSTYQPTLIDDAVRTTQSVRPEVAYAIMIILGLLLIDSIMKKRAA